MLTEIRASREFAGLGWRQDDDGGWIALHITDAGLQVIGVDPDERQPEGEAFQQPACRRDPQSRRTTSTRSWDRSSVLAGIIGTI